MTKGETNDIKTAVKEAVHEQLPETLAETLSPMIRRTVRDVLRPFRRAVVGGYVLLCLAIALLYTANRERVNDIQEQRRAFCQDQNLKHDATIREIDKQVAERAKRMSSRGQLALRERQDQTVVLIDALAPKQKCDRLTDLSK